MAKKKYIIPKCPECKEELTEVYEDTFEKYFFNKKTGKYEEISYRGSCELKCTNCNADISDIFEEGACNYQANRSK